MAENAQISGSQPMNTPRNDFPQWILHAVVAVLVALAVGFSTFTVYQEAVADAREDAAAAEEEGEEVAEELVVEFDIEDAYGYWAMALTAAVLIEALYLGYRRGYPFAMTVQLALIIMLLFSFALISQRIERDIYEFGTLALIVFTLLQIVFGNVNPKAGWKTSLLSVVVGGGIIGGVVALAIYLVPYLIELGR